MYVVFEKDTPSRTPLVLAPLTVVSVIIIIVTYIYSFFLSLILIYDIYFFRVMEPIDCVDSF